MAYSELADILKEIDETVLTEITQGAGAPDATKVATAIARADSIINGLIASRVTVPLTVVPDTVKVYSVDIAIYTLFTRVESVPKFRIDRYKAAMAFLINFRDNGGSLGGSTSAEGEHGDDWPLYLTADKDIDADDWEKY